MGRRAGFIVDFGVVGFSSLQIPLLTLNSSMVPPHRVSSLPTANAFLRWTEIRHIIHPPFSFASILHHPPCKGVVHGWMIFAPETKFIKGFIMVRSPGFILDFGVVGFASLQIPLLTLNCSKALHKDLFHRRGALFHKFKSAFINSKGQFRPGRKLIILFPHPLLITGRGY